YGSDGIGGVINIITKKPGDELSFTASLTSRFLLAYDNPNTEESPSPFEKDLFDPLREQIAAASLGLPIGVSRNTFSIEGSRAGEYLNEGKTAAVLPRYYRGKAALDTVFPLGDSAEMSAGGSFMAMRSDERTDAKGSFTRKDYIRADAYLEMELSSFTGTNINIRLYDNYYRRNKDDYSALTNKWGGGDYDNENYAALEAMGTYDGVENWIFTAGMEGAVNTLDKYNIRKDGIIMVDKEALFFQAEWFRVNTFSLLGGIRLERNSQFGFAPAPKVSAMYHLGRGWRILGGAGLGYRAPSFTDLYVTMDDAVVSGHPTVLGNENLKPEYALGFNLGLEYSKPGLFSARINGYYSELWNEIAYVFQGYGGSGSEIHMNENIYRSLRTGFDTEGRLDFLKYWYVSLGYSWLFAWDRSEQTELHLQPSHTAKGKAGFEHSGSGISTYLQGRFFSPLDPDNPSYDPRFILDLYVSVAAGKHFKIHAGIDNILGEINSLGPVTAQTFYLGLKYSL
ncbi:MAG: TonB-dependent receptor, partial [Spirochaetaceae bacterium]|nr:TonB-dependent receptor [Spirochaetaceae bacterium]